MSKKLTEEDLIELLTPRINERMKRHFVSQGEYDAIIDYHIDNDLTPMVDANLANAGYCNVVFLGVAWEVQ